MNQNPYVFIVGCPRSGTKLLRRIVDAHPAIAIIRTETHWIPSWFKARRGLTVDGLVKPEHISDLWDNFQFERLCISREDLERLIDCGSVSYATFVTGIFNLYGKLQRKPLVGDKTPGYARWLPTLHELWPRARFVHLIRDGRDVCLSAIDWKKRRHAKKPILTDWERDPLAKAAQLWESHVRLAREAATSLPSELYHEIRYESLVAEPAAECKALCSFLGLPYDDAMLRFHEEPTRFGPGLSATHRPRPITPGLRDWTTQMPAEDVERFEALVGNLLVELGYPRAAPPLKPEVKEHAAMIRNLFPQSILPVWKGKRLTGS